MRISDLTQLQRLWSALPDSPGGPRLVVSGNLATPMTALAAWDAAVPEYVLHVLNARAGVPDRAGVTPETCFVGPGMRRHPRLRYVPARLSLVPLLLHGPLAPDVVLLHTTTPRSGAVSLGIEVNILPAAIEAARARGAMVVAVANPRMPATGGDAVVPLDLVDHLVEVEEELPVRAPGAGTGPAAVIGERIAADVLDGSALQLGIGAVPDAALAALTGKRGLTVWSEMFSDGVLGLERAGALDADVPVQASFCFGSAELYDWVSDNDRVRMLRTERANDPGMIARQPGMTSINAALQVDLFDQVNASRIGTQVHSGFGGSTDFIVGALHARGGRAVIALPSWHPRADVSTVVARLTGPVTSFQHTAVVTEQGTAEVLGRTDKEQAEQLIERCAHPDARPELRAAARLMGLSREA